MSWNIDFHGDITPLDDGTKVPWWLATDEDYDEEVAGEEPRDRVGD